MFVTLNEIVSFIANLERGVLIQSGKRVKDLLLRVRVVENFTWSFGRLRQKNCSKEHASSAADYFSPFNQSYHWFVTLSLPLPSSFLILLNHITRAVWERCRFPNRKCHSHAGHIKLNLSYSVSDSRDGLLYGLGELGRGRGPVAVKIKAASKPYKPFSNTEKSFA